MKRQKHRNREYRSQNTDQAGQGLQLLEERILMSASPIATPEFINVSLSAGVITIDGTSLADEATVDYSTDSKGRKTVKVTTENFNPLFDGKRVTEFLASEVDMIVFKGYEGNDTYENNTSVNSYAYGNQGEDTLIGGSGVDVISGGNDNDTIYGNNGGDTLYGGSGNDTIYGNGGNDTIKGYGGSDTIFGGSGADDIWGNSGSDVIQGGSSGDYLNGGSGNDRLLGNSGSDQLFGKAGKDGMYGGSGTDDELNGGDGSDRYLMDKDPGDVIVEDIIKDYDSSDVTIYFRDGVKTEAFDDEWASKIWTSSDVAQVDESLAILHRYRTSLLEMADGSKLTFVRQGTNLTNKGSTVAWNNNNGRIYLPDAAFTSSMSLEQTMFHEIAHNWDNENSNWDDFKDISDWKIRISPFFDSSFTDTHSVSQDGEWYHLNNGFARNYGTTNPYEDFATSFAAYVMDDNGMSYSGGGVSSMHSEKISFMADFLA